MALSLVRRMPRWGITLASAALLSTSLAGLARAADPQPAPQPMQVVQHPEVFQLAWQEDHRSDAAALHRAVNPGGRVKLGTVLDAEDFRQGQKRCHEATDSGGVLHGLNVPYWYCLTPQNATTRKWTPQGVSGTEDSSPSDGKVDGRRAFVFSWHSGPVGGSGRGTRLSFLDPDTAKYVHVLLVEPRSRGGNTTYSDLTTHAGGIAWYKNYLFVADVRGGLRVFDMNNLLDLADSDVGNTTDNEIGLHNGTYYARGYSFALPEIGVWHNQHDTGNDRVTYDYMSLDYTTPSRPEALTGEWCDPARRQCTVGRVARWTMSSLTAFGGTVDATRAYHQPTPYTQGGLSADGCYYFNDGSNRPLNKYLITTHPGSMQTPTVREGAAGLQDLYLLASRQQLWTVTENRGFNQRVLYGVSRPTSCP